MSSFPLGPFQLDGLLGRGGMGEVWAGVHRTQGVPIAVKVLRGFGARKEAFIQAFNREVRSVARLSHPGIVQVFDYGVVSSEIAERSAGRLDPGSPYLVMERARGTVTGRCGMVAWEEAVGILVEILAALSHAHARGVIHRDLKPDNVLLSEHGLRLADFGLAADAEAAGLLPTGGTPAYMAPEQFEGRWRDFGPWTDLYALGCLAHTLLCGRPPFHGHPSLSLAHLTQAAPPLRTPTPVPAELQQWLDALLEKDHRRRPQFAADAASMLANMGVPTVVTGASSVPSASSTSAWQSSTLAGDCDTAPWLPSVRDSALLEATTADPDWAVDVAPPISESVTQPAVYRRLIGSVGHAGDSTGSDVALVGVGLGLFGLRGLPLIGRAETRRALWEALVRVSEGDVGEAVVIHGPAGVGKSRLAQWLTERAHEVGAAHILKATHGDPVGPEDGLVPMLARHLRCTGLSRPDIAARIQAALPHGSPREIGALTELIRPLARDEAPAGVFPVRLDSDAERYQAIEPLLSALTEKHAAVVWLDDVQWGADQSALSPLPWASHLLQSRARVLIVLTVRDEALGEAQSAALSRFMVDERAAEHPVEPLSDREQTGLVASLLGLSNPVAEQVVSRTGGNPLFAVHLVGDWVERGILVPSSEGFVPTGGEALIIPDAIHDLWQDRMHYALRNHPEERPALEIAAVLGVQVDDGEWRESCERAAAPPADAVWEALQRQGLVIEESGGWSFTHGMLAESIVRVAREEGRLRKAVSAIGQTLLGRGRSLQERGVNRDAERILARAVHLLESSEHRQLWVESLNPLADVYRCLGRLDRAQDLFGVVLKESQREGFRQEEGIALGCLGQIQHEQGRTDEAQRTLEAALSIHREVGNQHHEGIVLVNLGRLHHDKGRREEARRCALQALALHRAAGRRHEEGGVLRMLGVFEHVHGNHEGALRYYQEALELHRAVGNQAHIGRGLCELGNLYRTLGRFEEARVSYEEAIAIHRTIGLRRSEGVALGNLGTLYKELTKYDQALRYYHEALVIQRELENRRSVCIIQINSCEVHRLSARHTEARRCADEALRLGREIGLRFWEGAALQVRGLLDIAEGNFEKAEETLSAALVCFREARNRPYEGYILVNIGELMLTWGRLEEAASRLEEGIAVCDEANFAVPGASGRGILGLLQGRRGDVGAARDNLSAGEAVLREYRDQTELGKLLCRRCEVERLAGDRDAEGAALAEAEQIAGEIAAVSGSDLGRLIAAQRAAMTKQER